MDRSGRGSAGGSCREACLDFVLAQAEVFKTALDTGEDLTANYMDGMQPVLGTWYNVDVDAFIEAALACTGLVPLETLGASRIVLMGPGTGFLEEASFPEVASWNDIRKFFWAGQSYE